MLYLYFPEDKSQYIPALISFTIFLVICILTFLWFIKYSKKEELKTKDLEEQIRKERNNKPNSPL
ncbi:hypothetical protein [Bacillus andreraoultii]|uniref:hypothetical protein n=1 Tax=Bacillus andreraoultii TaxID=1499685 RepID=UPI000A532300|nr:hypothetical protein [Bacillus andreraoultii]